MKRHSGAAQAGTLGLPPREAAHASARATLRPLVPPLALMGVNQEHPARPSWTWTWTWSAIAVGAPSRTHARAPQSA
jgi:hypothetical protein